MHTPVGARGPGGVVTVSSPFLTPKGSRWLPCAPMAQREKPSPTESELDGRRCFALQRAWIDGGGPDWSRTSGTRFRKPLLYPSELRGHGRATLVHRFDLREAALALDEGRLASLATELATVHPTFRTG